MVLTKWWKVTCQELLLTGVSMDHSARSLHDKSCRKLLTMATRLSVCVAIVLALLKLSIWWFSGSVSVLASFMDSLLDIAASIISLFAVRIALKPADADHHFGHAKAEQLAALAQASFVAGSALYLIFYAADNLRSGDGISHPDIAIFSMLFSILIIFGLVTFQYYVIARTDSTAIRADAMHYKMDILVNTGVLIALFLSKYGWYQVDSITSIIIAFIMLVSIRKLGWDAIQTLMDQALPEHELKKIRRIILADSDVIGMDGLKTRKLGQQRIIQFHITVDKTLSLKEAHVIGVRVEKQIISCFHSTDIISCVKPCTANQLIMEKV